MDHYRHPQQIRLVEALKDPPDRLMLVTTTPDSCCIPHAAYTDESTLNTHEVRDSQTQTGDTLIPSSASWAVAYEVKKEMIGSRGSRPDNFTPST
jgi:hypothetical protein